MTQSARNYIFFIIFKAKERKLNLWFKIEYSKVIENLKSNKMLDPLGQAWQSGSALAAHTPGRATVNKHRICGPLYFGSMFFDVNF